MSEDGELIARMVAGDREALDRLMAKYDRLVRFTILRISKHQCAQDPQWMDVVASNVWMGFIRSMQRGPVAPALLGGYLAQITRNHCISALRKWSADFKDSAGAALDKPLPAEVEDAASIEERLELLAAIRQCVDELEPQSKLLISQLPRIVERRWKDAARVLGCSESTLRSRWAQLLERLRTKLGDAAEGLARRGEKSDS